MPVDTRIFNFFKMAKKANTGGIIQIINIISGMVIMKKLIEIASIFMG